jgi:mitotic spindle assembly checkpoint protein MAD2
MAVVMKGVFNLLVYANKTATVPLEWVDSDPLHIKNAEQVRLRSFSTGIHKIDTAVCYKYDAMDSQLT